MIRINLNRAVGTCNRVGATLVEVLMSLLIMSIGIVSVIALFPVAILSSIKATQLTNAKLLEENVVELLRTYPQLAMAAPAWKPNSPFTTQTDPVTAPTRLWVLPTRLGNTALPNSNIGYFSSGGITGAQEPVWPTTTGSTVTDGTVTWTAGPWSSDRVQYAIDPLGLMLTPSANDFFGTSSVIRPSMEGVRNQLNLTVPDFQKLFTLPDSWSTTLSAVPQSVTTTSVTFPVGTDLSDITTPSSYRVTLVSLDGTLAATRSVASVPTGTAVPLGGPNLPVSIVNNFGAARLEVFNPRYTWMLTVQRNTLGRSKIQCAIFFNRSFNPDNEHSYTCNYVTGINDAMTVSWAVGTDPTPLISEGSYAFDATHCRWYKIVTGTSNPSGQVTLDSSLTPSVSNQAAFVFPPGVIRVFDIEL